jgi:hypothetical protein
MEYTSSKRSTKSLMQFVAGFFGAMLIVTLLPRTLRLFVRKLFFGLAGEIIAVVVAGLLTEKAVDKLGNGDR